MEIDAVCDRLRTRSERGSLTRLLSLRSFNSNGRFLPFVAAAIFEDFGGRLAALCDLVPAFRGLANVFSPKSYDATLTPI